MECLFSPLLSRPPSPTLPGKVAPGLAGGWPGGWRFMGPRLALGNQTPCILCAAYCLETELALLIEAGADVNKGNDEGTTPLLRPLAIYANKVSCLSIRATLERAICAGDSGRRVQGEVPADRSLRCRTEPAHSAGEVRDFFDVEP